MHSTDRRLCALVRQMAAQPSQPIHQTPRTDKPPPHEDFPLSTDKLDCERGALVQDIQPDSSRSIRMYFGLLRLAGFLSIALLAQRFWPVTLLPSRYHPWETESVLALDSLCPQVEALTPPGHEALLGSLDEEFGSSEFKLKAYESLGGAVRIP